jgi:hypothetical protein
MSPTQPAHPVNSAEQAAQAIIELINSRPTSPRPDEIVEIIRQLAVARPSASCSHCHALDREYGPASTRSP